MKPCPYCGRTNDAPAATCDECGNHLLPAIKSNLGVTIPAWLVAVAKVIVGFSVMGFCAILSLGLLIRGCDPATPKTGYTGDWRYTSTFPVFERDLPPAADVWTDLQAWEGTNGQHSINSSRIYNVKLAGAHRQKKLRGNQSYTQNMPLGDHNITFISFEYHDETNGVYNFTWMQRGHHDPDFLRLTETPKTFQVRAYGSDPKDVRLSIVAIEGVTPF